MTELGNAKPSGPGHSHRALLAAGVIVAAITIGGGVAWFTLHRNSSTFATVSSDCGEPPPGVRPGTNGESYGTGIGVQSDNALWTGFGPEKWAAGGVGSTLVGTLRVDNDTSAVFIASDETMSEPLTTGPNFGRGPACNI